MLESENTVGIDSLGDIFSNKEEIEALPLGPENYSFHSFETCVDSNTNTLNGIQYTLISNLGETIALNGMDKMKGTCQSLELSGSIEKI